MKKRTDRTFENLPGFVGEFIELVIKKMGYRKTVRCDVMAEFIGHFEDELRSCENAEEKLQKAKQLIADFGDVKMLGRLLRRAKKRCRPLWRTVVARSFQGVGLLFLYLFLYCVYISFARPNVSVNYIEEMTRLNRPVVDEGLNAAPIYQKAIDAYNEPTIDREETYRVRTMRGKRRGDTRKERPPRTQTRIVEELLLAQLSDKDWIADLTEQELVALRQGVADNAEAIEFFKQAVAKPYCWWQREVEDNVVWAMEWHELGPLKNLARITAWGAKLKAYNGDVEGAFDDLLSCYRAGAHFKGPRMLVEQMVGMSIEALAVRNVVVILNKCEVDSELAKSFQGRFEKLFSDNTYTTNYGCEKFFALDFIQRSYTDNGRGSGRMTPALSLVDDGFTESTLGYGAALVMSLVSANRADMTGEFEKFFQLAQDYAHKSPWQLKQENVDLEMGLINWSFFKKARYWPVSVLMPALTRVNELSYQRKTGTHALITILGVMRYKNDVGSFPDDLAQLVAAGYIKDIPQDPFAGKELVYRKTDNDFILYGVGRNFTDDGGEVVRDRKGRVQLWGTREEGDAVFWPVGVEKRK